MKDASDHILFCGVTNHKIPELVCTSAEVTEVIGCALCTILQIDHLKCLYYVAPVAISSHIFEHFYAYSLLLVQTYSGMFWFVTRQTMTRGLHLGKKTSMVS